ncbi:hypothetical protein [Companilactobacillus zhongbaensis]|uniref:hypothetical protein n=1 Tax=Companilactobacillus zhongbaensis TaxID=2486009 RepID=UPI001CDD7762|nr:hypothetical protein [Companilactobacillus zhongbaensis]
MKTKCFDFRSAFKGYIENNIVKILMSITIAMIFVIANSQILIYAAIYGTWMLAFTTLFVLGYMLSYAILSLVFRLLGK